MAAPPARFRLRTWTQTPQSPTHLPKRSPPRQDPKRARAHRPALRLPPWHGRLHRSRRHGLVAGVAAGLADYLDLDPTLVRLGFVGLALFGGLAVPLYLAGWLLIPDEGAGSSVLEDLLSHGPFREYTH